MPKAPTWRSAGARAALLQASLGSCAPVQTLAELLDRYGPFTLVRVVARYPHRWGVVVYQATAAPLGIHRSRKRAGTYLDKDRAVQDGIEFARANDFIFWGQRPIGPLGYTVARQLFEALLHHYV